MRSYSLNGMSKNRFFREAEMKRCKKCGDSGIIYDGDNIVAGSHGELKLCDCIEKECSCGAVSPYEIFTEGGGREWCPCRSPRIRLAAVKKAFRDSEIPRKYFWKFSNDFKIDFKEKDIVRKANKILGTFATIKDKPADEKLNKGFYLWGPPGSGKTLLAAITLQELMLKYAQPGKYIDLSRTFFQRMRSTFDRTDDSYGSAGQIVDRLISVPFLVIDDFGTQRNTEWESEMLYNLIDSRYSEEKVTIITSNISLKQYLASDRGDNSAPIPVWTQKDLGKAAKNPNAGKSRNGTAFAQIQGGKQVDMSRHRIYSRINEMCDIIHVDLPDYRESMARYY